ncbi:MAG: multidrug effflux MFS transporter [Thiohalorhabdus sp.]|uniref:multidrug effflux MFS transporter n=1 Tax=Thiohalorhabdus sp. TaxID=3094134 RepID=UPI0039817EA9
MNHTRLALLLGATVAVSPLAMDAYLPAFPEIAATYGIASGEVGVTVSVYLVGLALGHLVGGPLSDRYGRDRVLYGGLALFLAGSLLVAASPSFAALTGWRFLQALGAGWCVVSVPAIARDHSSGAEGAQLFSLIGLVIFVAPAAAPSIGTLILTVTGWPGIFVFLAAYAGALAVLLRLTLFRRWQGRPSHRHPLHTVVTNYATVLRHRTAMRLLAVQSLVFSVMILFITHASFIFQEWYGLSKAAFSGWMAAHMVLMGGFNLLNRWLLNYRHPSEVLRVAIGLQAAAALYLAGIALTEPSLALFLPGLLLAIGSFGAGVPNTFSLYLDFFRDIAATASALMGAVRFSVAGGISATSSMLVGGSLWGVTAMMAACALTALLLAWGVPRAVERSAAG